MVCYTPDPSLGLKIICCTDYRLKTATPVVIQARSARWNRKQKYTLPLDAIHRCQRGACQC